MSNIFPSCNLVFELRLRVFRLVHIALEGDSEIVFKAMVCEDSSFADHGHLIEEAKLLSSSFTSCSFSHVKRQGNSAAHHLARHARHVSSQLVWLENVPPQILAVTLADLVSIY